MINEIKKPEPIKYYIVRNNENKIMAYGVVEQNQQMQTGQQLPTIILFIASYFYGGLYEVWLVLLGCIFGNLPDLIDKKLYLAIIYPTKFKATIYLHWQKVIYNPAPIVVKYQGIAMVSFVLIIYLLKLC